jgi:hypothetical protein
MFFKALEYAPSMHPMLTIAVRAAPRRLGHQSRRSAAAPRVRSSAPAT